MFVAEGKDDKKYLPVANWMCCMQKNNKSAVKIA